MTKLIFFFNSNLFFQSASQKSPIPKKAARVLYSFQIQKSKESVCVFWWNNYLKGFFLNWKRVFLKKPSAKARAFPLQMFLFRHSEIAFASSISPIFKRVSPISLPPNPRMVFCNNCGK